MSFAPQGKLFCLPRIVDAANGTFAEATIDHIGDFNGDGLADFYLVYAGAYGNFSGNFIGIAITQAGAGIATINSCNDIGLLSNDTPTDDCTWNRGYATRWMDVNADGLEDLVLARPQDADISWRLHLNLGNGQFGPEINTRRTDRKDSNQYGLQVDYTGQVGTRTPYLFRYANKLPAMDADADGKVDLLIPSQLPGPQAFALKMCTITRVPKLTGGDVPVCP